MSVAAAAISSTNSAQNDPPDVSVGRRLRFVRLRIGRQTSIQKIEQELTEETENSVLALELPET